MCIVQVRIWQERRSWRIVVARASSQSRRCIFSGLVTTLGRRLVSHIFLSIVDQTNKKNVTEYFWHWSTPITRRVLCPTVYPCAEQQLQWCKQAEQSTSQGLSKLFFTVRLRHKLALLRIYTVVRSRQNKYNVPAIVSGVLFTCMTRC
jgi:hypothetical protein